MLRSHLLHSLSFPVCSSSSHKDREGMDIDVVISIGGFYGFFMIGADKILKQLERDHQIRIQRYAGSSVGAICAVCMACDISAESVLDLYESLREHPFQYFPVLRERLLNILPIDAYLRCSHRVFIHATKLCVFPLRLQHVIISLFYNNEDLVDAMMASSNMPFLVSSQWTYRFRGEHYMDGCFSRCLPLFEDNKYPQLLMKLYNIQYYGPFSYAPTDPSIESLIIKGAIETERFFSKKKEGIHTLAWHIPASSRPSPWKTWWSRMDVVYMGWGLFSIST